MARSWLGSVSPPSERKVRQVSSDSLGSMESFETWLLRRVAQAVEAGEIPAALLAELQAEIETARERPQEEGHAEAVQDITARLDIPLEQAEKSLNTIEALPTVTRELLMRYIVEAWLEGERRAYRASCKTHVL